ncbi:MAG TPA: BTAD domain-containing putative transcriptional regulator [Roseiflexaceae bacterium]|nr:BTAD domain-containing putative transcriptional regulator [Roseiflexaceae bacterium]HMP42831.1 BTAD domain-containing putative transcriptional regulator [Roseiflexaceae bacterium]
MPINTIPIFSMAVLACWLGLSLLVRTPQQRQTQLFAWLCLNLTLYGLTAVLPQFTTAPEVALVLLRLHTAESVLLPPIFLHFLALLVARNPFPAWQRVIGAAFYILSFTLALYALVAPGMQLIERAGWATLRFPAGPLVLAWAIVRIIPLLLGLLVLIIGYRRTNDTFARRRLALVALAALTGVGGALWIIIGRELALSLTSGHLLMAAALVIFAYTVLSHHSLLPERVAQRAFYRSLAGGVLTALYIGALLVAEPLVAAWLQIEVPIVTMISLTTLIAVFGPLRDHAGEWFDRRFFQREFDYSRLLRAVSTDLLERSDLTGQVRAALLSICSTLDLQGGLVAIRHGAGLRILALHGDQAPPQAMLDHAALPITSLAGSAWDVWPAARLLVPLRSHDEIVGVVALRERRSGEPFSPTEHALLDSLGSYMALAIRHAQRQQEEELAMAALAEQSRQLQIEQEQLQAQARAILHTPAETLPGRLHVFALGPLRVERGGRPIERWGGDKAGTYQAEALFAFLFDRRGRGISKDEAAEVIWPDLMIDKADMAFHRTISALRRTLEPGLRRAGESRTITFHHDRYWLNPDLIAWCDTDQFSSTTAQAHRALRDGDGEQAYTLFLHALALYRGEYLDDCPFFGDSSYVEERRSELRESQIDALIALGTIYEQREQIGEAATCYRRAITAAGGSNPRAEERLAQLQVTL